MAYVYNVNYFGQTCSESHKNPQSQVKVLTLTLDFFNSKVKVKTLTLNIFSSKVKVKTLTLDDIIESQSHDFDFFFKKKKVKILTSNGYGIINISMF